MEEPLTTGFEERQITQLIERHQIEAKQFCGYFMASHLACSLKMIGEVLLYPAKALQPAVLAIKKV